jgi:uncharacterized membrane protein
LLPVTAGATWWLGVRSDAMLGGWRRRLSTALRLLLVSGVVLALAGFRWRHPVEGMNTFFLLDRSDSLPASTQESARDQANRWATKAKPADKAGFLVFGSEAALESEATAGGASEKIQAVVPGERTDIASAIRLATAAFPESGQKRLVLLSDGHENLGDARQALAQARRQGATLDVLPLGGSRGSDLSVRKIVLPATVKRGSPFEARVHITSDAPRRAKVRLLRNDRLLGEQEVSLEAGRNLFTFPQRLEETGFHGYEVAVEAEGDTVPQNNRATGFTSVRGTPRILLVSSSPEQDINLVEALRPEHEVRVLPANAFPSTLAEIQDFDAVILGNVGAGVLGPDRMRLLESAVRDFGVGLLCIGGDDSFTAGAYRGTPLEAALPVSMELSSKKVLPAGALVLVMHGMEFANGNQVSREIGLAALNSLGPRDELGVVLWDGSDRWLLDLAPVGDRAAASKAIAGMNQGDLPAFEGLMTLARDGLRKSTANLKHILVFSDGDPAAASDALLESIVDSRITVSTIMIGAHVAPRTMIRMAEAGRGRFYEVRSSAELPQIFIKETAVILKSAIDEAPFVPRVASATEPLRGLEGPFPVLRGHVVTEPKARAEIPLVTPSGDPLLAHWQHGLGRTAAFTSDARSRWAQDWLGWGSYKRFWMQATGWVLRRVDTAEFQAEAVTDRGEGRLSVDAVDTDGTYRNFLELTATAVSPTGRRTEVRLEQKGPGHYEASFPAGEVGAYLIGLAERRDGRIVAMQSLGTTVNTSPEFETSGANQPVLESLAQLGGGRILDPSKDNPFLLDRVRTRRPVELWEGLLKWIVLLLVADIGLRRIEIDREEWGRWIARLRRLGSTSDADSKVGASEESLQNLLGKRDAVRAARPAAPAGDPPVAVKSPEIRPEARVFPAAAPGPGSPKPPEPGAGNPAGSPGGMDRLLEAKRRARK